MPYFGRHSIKMFIRGKPIRFGYKIWCLCGNDGYPYHLQIYKGKEDRQKDRPLGTRVILDMLRVVEENSQPSCHSLYFDNFFTSHALMVELSTKNMKATETVRENRMAGASSFLLSMKQMKNQNFVAKWHDNSIVTMACNWQTHEPLRETKRRVKGSSNVTVTQPNLVQMYNLGMGGDDLLDRLCASYHPSIRGKKWWWPLLAHVLNASIVAAWRVHCAVDGTPLDHLSFRRQVAVCLMKSVAPRPQVGGGHVADMPDDVRYDGCEHERGSTTQGRCHLCSTNTRTRCIKCNVRLHAWQRKDLLRGLPQTSIG